MAALGALAAGLIVGLIGDRPALIGVVIAFTAAALTAALSPLREAPNRASPHPSGQRDAQAAACHQAPDWPDRSWSVDNTDSSDLLPTMEHAIAAW